MPNKKSDLFNYLYRKAHGGDKLWRLVYAFYTQYVLGCDIKPCTRIGKGFKIFHSAHGSVVNPATVIGENVSLRQNTTIGAKGFESSEKSPVIENDVTIGPNVCIIGNITVGHHSVIGAGAVVVKDVPPYAVVAGNPARIIRMLNSVIGGGDSILIFSYNVAA